MKRKLALFAIVLAVLMLVPAFALAAESDETEALESITGVLGPTKVSYKVGETFDPSGIKINVKYKSGNEYSLIAYSTSNGFSSELNGHDVDGYKFTKDDVGTDQVLTVRYTKNHSTVEDKSIKITVSDYLELTKLEKGNEPTKQSYFVGETFDKTGMTAKATYDVTKTGSPTTQTLTASQINVEAHTFTAGEAGKEVELVASYTEGGITKSYTFSVYVYDLANFTVTKQPTKQYYYYGESFDKTGTEFKATYKSYDSSKAEVDSVTKTIDIKNVFIEGRSYSKEDIDGAKTDPFPVTATFTYGDTTLNAGEKTGDVGIKTYVYKHPTLSIKTQPYKKTYLVGESFNPAGMVLVGTFTSNDSQKTVEKVLSGYNYSKAALKKTTTKVTVYYTYAEKNIGIDIPDIKVNEINGTYLYLDKASLFMTAGETKKVTATVLPEDTTDPVAEITWAVATGGDGIADVDEFGVVSAIGEGRTYITATLKSGAVATCYVNVEGSTPITSLKFNKTSLDLLLGDSTKLEPVIVPTDATVTKTWLSTAPKVVSVTDDGVIKGLKEGSAVITVSADGLQAKMNITVSKTLNTTGTVVNCQRRVNVRAKASGSSSSIGYAYLGQTFKILGEQDNWYKIQFNASKVGYIWKKYLSSNGGKDYTPVTEPTATTTVTTEGVSVTATDTDVTITAGTISATTATKVTITNCSRYVYIRKGAGTAYSKIGHAVPGAVFTLKGVSGDWYAIDYNGQVGYVMKDFCQLG